MVTRLYILLSVIIIILIGCANIENGDILPIPEKEQGNAVKMVFDGNPAQIRQKFNINDDLNKESVYRVSALFKTEDIEISALRHFGFRINFFKDDGSWFQTEDIDLSSLSISHDVEEGENTWSKSNSDGSQIRNSGGNVFVVNLDPYILQKSKEKWQKLFFSFSIPADATKAWISLYNHAESEGSTIIWADMELVDIDKPSTNLIVNGDFENLGLLGELKDWEVLETEISVIKRTGQQQKGPLAEWQDVRPRLFLTEELVNDLRYVKTDSQYQKFKNLVFRWANGVDSNPTTYRDDGGNLWQRNVGNMIPYLAMAYMLSGEYQYLEKAKNWTLGAVSYPVWHETLGRSHLLFGVAIAYDWLYNEFDEVSRKLIREKLVQEASRDLPDRSLANHYWIAITARGTAGMAVYDDINQGKPLIQQAVADFEDITRFLGQDGAGHEGVGYWQYSLEYMLKFMYLADNILRINYHNHPWWENTAFYGIYLSTPRNVWEVGISPTIGSVVDFGDTSRGNWYGPDYLMRRLAVEYNNGYAQWFAEKTNEAGVDNNIASWLNLIWYNSDIESKSPDNLPSLHHFEDMGIVSARSDWSGNESLLAFKAGPALGHHATDMVSYHAGDFNYLNRNSAGHSIPDANSFVLFGSGEWLVRNPGYVLRRTDYQNTLIVDGEGQLGQRERWWLSDEQVERKLHPQILKTKSTSVYDYIVGDATEAYPDLLERFVRHLIFIKPEDVLIVIDDISSNDPLIEREFKLNFHLEHTAIENEDGSFIAQGDNSILRVESLIPEIVLEGGMKTILSRSDLEIPRYALTVSKNSVVMRNALAFSWSNLNNNPQKVNFQEIEDKWIFYVGDYEITFDWTTKDLNIN